MTLSLMISLVGITGQFVMARHRAAGWWISLGVATPLWVTFALVLHQYPLLIGNAGYAAAAVANLLAIRRERRTFPVAPEKGNGQRVLVPSAPAAAPETLSS